MNKLCQLKGHMWFCSKRKDIMKNNEKYSICIEKQCTRCGKRERL